MGFIGAWNGCEEKAEKAMTIQRYRIGEHANPHGDRNGEWLHDPDRQIERKLKLLEKILSSLAARKASRDALV